MGNNNNSLLRRRRCLIQVDRQSFGGSEQIGSLQIVYGYANQSQLNSPYNGLQCTSICLAAVIYWYNKGYCTRFTHQDINRILQVGNRLHTRLRNNRQIVTFLNDGMVGLSDIPHQRLLYMGKIFERDVGFGLREESVPVVLSEIENELGLPTLQHYMTTYRPELLQAGFIVTIKYYSYAILRSAHQYTLFDSHGHLSLRHIPIVNRGMSIIFPDFGSLTNVLLERFEANELCDIAPVACCEVNGQSTTHTDRSNITIQHITPQNNNPTDTITIPNNTKTHLITEQNKNTTDTITTPNDTKTHLTTAQNKNTADTITTPNDTKTHLTTAQNKNTPDTITTPPNTNTSQHITPPNNTTCSVRKSNTPTNSNIITVKPNSKTICLNTTTTTQTTINASHNNTLHNNARTNTLPSNKATTRSTPKYQQQPQTNRRTQQTNTNLSDNEGRLAYVDDYEDSWSPFVSLMGRRD